MLLTALAILQAQSGLAQDDAAAKERAAERHRREQKRDSLAARSAEQAQPADSLPRLRIADLPPTLDPLLGSEEVVERGAIDWTLNRSLSLVLDGRAGFSVINLSSPGQYNLLRASGMGGRGISILVNGRSAVNPAAGRTCIDRIPTDMIERLEVVSGPRSFLYGWDGVGGVIHVVTKTRDTNVPVSHLSYVEGPYELQQVYGGFSQNVARGVNLSLEFDRSAGSGRYTSSLNDTWVALASLRAAFGPDMTATLSERYTSARTDLNGGISLARTPPGNAFVPGLATVVNPDAYEKVDRHDLDLTLAGRFLRDSTAVTRLSLYYSTALREYRDEENRSSPNGTFTQADHSSHWTGGILSQNLTAGIHRILAGASMEARTVRHSPALGARTETAAAAWLKDEMMLLPSLHAGLYGRLDRTGGASSVGAGADVTVLPATRLRLSLGGSFAKRSPSFTEMFWTDSTITRPGSLAAETHRLLEVRAAWEPAPLSHLVVRLFRRWVEDPLVLVPGGTKAGFPGFRVENSGPLAGHGIELSAAVRVWLLSLEGTALWQERTEGAPLVRELFPRLSGSGGLYLDQTFLEGNLPLRAGIRTRWQTSFRGELQNLEALALVPNTGTAIGGWAALDVDARAGIGDAIIFFLWENITDIRAYASPYYPLGDQAIWFGVSWRFLN